MTEPNAALPEFFAALLNLGSRARHASSASELAFLAVNDSHALAPYRQAALWLADGGVTSLSGVVQIEANVPYVQWLQSLAQHLSETATGALAVAADDLPPALAIEWAEWLPANLLWLPIRAGGLLFARDLPWREQDLALIAEWADIWSHAWQARHCPSAWTWKKVRQGLLTSIAVPEGQRWWQTRLARWGLGIAIVLLFPVRLSVLAPGELVPAQPAVIRAPLEGVIDTFHVQPNQMVTKDQPLFGFDEALIKTRLDVTRQALATAEAEYRQAAQQALSDSRSKAQLAMLTGKIEEKRAEANYVADQMGRARVLAPQDGIALFDDPSEWIGKPVSVGERIMRIADTGDVEVEAWIPLADAIPLDKAVPVSLYLNASPLSPVEATLRYLAHDAVERPDGSFAYRLRATLRAPTDHRVGLKGTARVSGGWVPLIYWALRRPWAGIRASVGW